MRRRGRADREGGQRSFARRRCDTADRDRRDDTDAALGTVFIACWAFALATGTGLATWSGTFYLPMPWWLATVAVTGLAWAGVGWALESVPVFRRVAQRACTTFVLVLVWLGLVAAGMPADTRFAPDIWSGIRDYRGKCLTGTEYTDPDAELSITTDVVTIVGSHGGVLRFTRTGDRWPSQARAEIFGRGAVPRDHATRIALAAAGCT
ncbi:hypothetical protein [Amycolatopsis sp. cmx-4-54]|uniref:hypothetical protein n=1 Tax=Amycolatopsis sp. cmx-4-54 TaxID=2790936 RepID=UPI00397CF8F3